MAELLDKVKEIELNILTEIIKICDKHDIKWFMDGGSLLGTVRHSGFIPWDDDIDIGMLRKDYNKFLKYAKKELKYPYFVQTGYTDKEFCGAITHIRKSDTTAILYKNVNKVRFNQGIFVDIFPYDGVSKSKILLKFQYGVVKLIHHILYIKLFYYKRGNKTFLKNVLYFIFLPLLVLVPKKFLFFLMDVTLRLGNLKSSNKVDIISYKFGAFDSNLSYHSKSIFENLITKKFEGMDVYIPSMYDSVLKAYYGDDYMTPKKLSSDHGEVFFDTKNSFIDYLNGNRKIGKN